MEPGRPSATAYRVAVRRAMHQLRDQPPVFADPLALAILGDDTAADLRMRATGPEKPWTRVLRLFLAARSRLAEDELARAVERGIRQYVVLGAGLDTFAYRNPFPDLRVFEIDHPDTQRWKRDVLTRTSIALPPSLTFTPVDFSRETLIDALARAGFVPTDGAFFSWLGVTPYLTTDVTLDTLRVIARMSTRNAIVFDYARPRSAVNFLHRLAFDAMAQRVAAAGEPFVGFFDTAVLEREMRDAGWTRLDDYGADELNALYFRDRRDGLRLSGKMGRIMSARVA